MNGFRYNSLHLPTAFKVLQDHGTIGSPRVIVEIRCVLEYIQQVHLY